MNLNVLFTLIIELLFVAVCLLLGPAVPCPLHLAD
jgi:hypothetical protein